MTAQGSNGALRPQPDLLTRRSWSPAQPPAPLRPAAASAPTRWSASTSPRATSSRSRSRFRISSAAARNDSDVAPQRHAGDHRQPEALRPVRADRSGGLHRERVEHRRAAAVCRLARHQRPGARHRPHHPPGRRPAEVGIPAVGCGLRRAAHRRAIFHRARHLAACRAHHLRRDLPAADRRIGLFRQPRGVRRRIRPQGAAGQAARASWIRTAPTCASSPAAAISC